MSQFKDKSFAEVLKNTFEKLQEYKLKLSFFRKVSGIFLELQGEDRCFLYDIGTKQIFTQNCQILRSPTEYIKEYNEFKQILLDLGFEVRE